MSTAAFATHGLCDTGDRWISGLVRGSPGDRGFHPNAAGQQAFAATIAARFPGSRRRQSPAGRGIRSPRPTVSARPGLATRPGRLMRCPPPSSSTCPSAPTPTPRTSGFVEWASEQGLTLYPAQDEAVIEIVSGSNVILSTPTGTGKSLVAVAAHAACLARGGRTYYTAPIKALVSEKFFALVDIFGAANVGMVTGDSSVNPDAPIICCTAEILANLALRQGADAARRPGRDGRVPLLRRPRPRLGVAGAAAAAAARAVRAHVGDARRRHRDRRRPLAPHRPPDGAHHRRRAPGAAALLVRAHARARDGRGAAADRARRRSTSSTSRRPRRWSARRRCRAIRIVSREQRDAIAEAIGGFRFTTAFGRMLSRYVRAGIGVHHAGMLPAVPPARRDARPARAAARDLRHRHARRRHQRAHPHGADHGAREVRRTADAAAQRPRVPPGRGARRPRRLRHRGHRRRDGARPRDRERRGRSRRPATTRRSSARSCARRRRRAS